MTTKNAQEVLELLSNGDDIEFILNCVFHHVPADPAALIFYNEKGPVYGYRDEYWWRSCVLKDGEAQGTQGYLKVWLDDGKITTHHTYRYPPNF